MAMSWVAPLNWSMTTMATSRVRTTGNRAGRLARTAFTAGPGLVQHRTVEEKQRRQGLVLGGRCHAALDAQVGEKGLNIGRAELRGMPEAVTADVPANPANVRFLGGWCVVSRPQGVVSSVASTGRG